MREKNIKTEWQSMVTGRRIGMFKIFGNMMGPKEKLDKLIGTHFANYLIISKEGFVDWYVDRNELFSKISKKMFEKILENKEFLQEHLIKFHESFHSLVDVTQKISRLDLKEKNNNELKKTFGDYYEKYKEMSVFISTPHIVEAFATGKIKEFLRLNLSKRDKTGELENYFVKLMVPSDETFETKQKRELLKIAIKIKDDSKRKKLFEKKPDEIVKKIREIAPDVGNLIEEFAEKWAWVGQESYIFPSFDEAYWVNVIYGILRMTKVPEQQLKYLTIDQRKREEEVKNIFFELQPNEEMEDLIKIMQKYIFLRTERLESFRRAHYYTKPLLLEIGKRMGLTNVEILYVTPDEIMEFLEKGKPIERQKINERKSGFVIFMREGKLQIFEGKEWVEKFEREELKVDVTRVNTFEGIGIYPGVVRGTVKIVRSIADIDRVKEGDILVTTMTMPDYTTAIHKAGGIVTDEGGITCHAAIVSRELQIPCVIGTAIATKVLKNGDEIEVNSKEGLIKVIKDAEGKSYI